MSPSTDLAALRARLPYRDCAGAALFNRQGLVFVGHRMRDIANDPEARAWQMPQGGIDKGEDPLGAARRELAEETGVRSVSLLAELPDWVFYDLPDAALGLALKGKYRGQRQRWFAFLFEGTESEINVLDPGHGEKPEFDRWQWAPLTDLPELIVPFKRLAYEQIVQGFAHLPQAVRDRQR